MNIYYLIINIIEDTTRETYRLFISAASYREAVDKTMNSISMKSLKRLRILL